MSQLPEQALSSLPIWLNILAKIFPPNRVTLVGAGNGTGPLVQWLVSQDLAEVTLFEADTNSFAQLVRRTGQIPGWLARQELVVPGMSTDDVNNFYRYQLASESGLLDLGDLQALWPNLQMHSQQTMQGIDLDGLPPADWLMLDCLPAAHLLRGAALQHAHVILARVVLSEAHNTGSSLAELHTQLVPQGYQLAACFAERNAALGKALWMRDPARQLTQTTTELQGELEQAKAQAQQQLSQTKTELQAKLEAETKARQASETQAKTLEAQKAEVLAQKDALAKAQEQTGTQIKALQSELEQAKAQAQQQLSQTMTELQVLREESDVVKQIKEEWSEANKNPYAHNRTLTSSLNASLRDFASKSLGLQNVKSAYIDYLALKAQQVEKNCVGRLATTVQDAVARQLVMECVSGEKAHILEIGALYGIGLGMLYNHAITRFSEVKVICLDPFDGYYGKALDALLNQPVNESTFQRNMKLANVPDGEYTIIKRYSTDPLSLNEIKKQPFNVLIIDGDHSYEGVKFDFETYFPLLEKGGYVILDDYNAKEWPGVQKFVDEELKSYVNFQYLGSFSRTAIGRKRY